MLIHRIGFSLTATRYASDGKSNNRAFARDISKLRGLTKPKGEYGYLVGIHLVVDVEDGKVERCDVYADGEQDAGLTIWLREQVP